MRSRLPSILTVAEENGLMLDQRSYGKKESLCKCPFCNEDSNKNKFYLSLNTEHNVYKCWYCAKSGGVLDFEARLTGNSFEQVRSKYFGERRKPRHEVERLNHNQLNKIGWQEKKSKDFQSFIKSKEQVVRDWKEYESRELRKMFALFKVITIDGDKNRQLERLEQLIGLCKETNIENAYIRVVEQHSVEYNQREEWAKIGTELARVAWASCKATRDLSLNQIMLYVLFSNYSYEEQRIARV